MEKTRNRLLSALCADDRSLIASRSDRTCLNRHTTLEAANKPIETVYFIENGLASVIATNGRGENIEVGLVGREGMSGVTIVMGNHRSPHSVQMQVSGDAYAIPAPALRRVLGQSNSMRTLFLHYAQVFMTQAAQTAIANGRARLEQRLARRILMAHDRLGENDVPITHEFLSMMLGVRRASVSVALDGFRKRGLIDARRGGIIIVDRESIEKIAGNYYGVPETEFHRLIG